MERSWIFVISKRDIIATFILPKPKELIEKELILKKIIYTSLTSLSEEILGISV